MSIHFSVNAERVLNNVLVIAENLGHTFIGSEHLLLSLAKETDCEAAKILTEHNVDIKKLEDAIVEYSGIGEKTVLNINSDITPRLKKIVENAYEISKREGNTKINTKHLLKAICEDKKCVGYKILIMAKK